MRAYAAIDIDQAGKQGPEDENAGSGIHPRPWLPSPRQVVPCEPNDECRKSRLFGLAVVRRPWADRGRCCWGAVAAGQ